MERRVPIEWRLASLAVAAVFLLTSCPAPMVGSRSTPVPVAPVADRGKIKCCYIDHGGEFTDDVDGAYGKLYWVERDGRTQPGLVSVGRKDNMINVVNFVDTDSGNRFRLFFMDQTNLPYRMVVECKDDSGNWRTLVGEELRYNQDAQELSLRFTDRDDSSQSAVLSGVRLNSELFTLKQGIFTEGDPAQIHLGYSYDQYLVTISACLLYAIGQSDMNWSEGSADFAQPQMPGRWGWSWKGVVRGLSAVFTCVAVVSFVVATVLAPAVVVAGGSVMVAVTGANSVWAGVAVGSATLAVASAVGAEYIDEPETYTKTKAEYGSGTQEEPPMVAVWQVDSSGEPQDNPGQDGWFTNDGIVHLHYQDQDATEQYLCLQWLGGTRPVSLEFGQSSSSFLAHTAALLKDFSTKEKIFDPNTQSSLSPVPDRFYLSIKKKSDIRGSNPKEFYTFVVFNPKSDSMVALVNGTEGLSTRLENKNRVLTDEAKYKNIFKVNICTDELHCPDRN